MVIKCLIVDDEPLSRKVLKSYILDHPDLELLGVCKDALEAMEFVEKRGVELLFLDINMPKLSGINFYKALRKKPEVIFTTAYPEYAVEGFDLEALDYLLKPIAFERFLKSVQKAREKLRSHHPVASEPDHIMLKADRKMYRTLFEEVMYFEALGDYVKVHLKDKTIIVTITLKKLLMELPSTRFVRTHKSYIINIQHVRYLEGNQLNVHGQMVPIGQAYREEVQKSLYGNTKE
jgi:DNA-binding LytR/AlgR family response regulator